MGDLEGIVLSTLDVVTRGPGEGAILGLRGDDLDILQVGRGSFSEGESDGLNAAIRVSDLKHTRVNVNKQVPGQWHHQSMSE